MKKTKFNDIEENINFIFNKFEYILKNNNVLVIEKKINDYLEKLFKKLKKNDKDLIKKINYYLILMINSYGLKIIKNINNDSLSIFKLALKYIKNLEIKNKLKLEIITKNNIGIYFRTINNYKKALKVVKNIYYSAILINNKKILSLIYNNLSVIYFDLKEYNIGYDYIKLSWSLQLKLIIKIKLYTGNFYKKFKFFIEFYLFSIYNQGIFEKILKKKECFNITITKLKELIEIYQIDNELKEKLLSIVYNKKYELIENFYQNILKNKKEFNKKSFIVNIQELNNSNKKLSIKSTSNFLKIYKKNKEKRTNTSMFFSNKKFKIQKKKEEKLNLKNNKKLIDLSYKYINKVDKQTIEIKNVKTDNIINKYKKSLKNFLTRTNYLSKLLTMNKKTVGSVSRFEKYNKKIFYIQKMFRQYLAKKHILFLNTYLSNYKIKFKKYVKINNLMLLFNIKIEINYKYIELNAFNKNTKKINRIFNIKDILSDEYYNLYMKKKSIINFKNINNWILKKLIKMITIKFKRNKYIFALKDNLFLKIKVLEDFSKNFEINEKENNILIDHFITSYEKKFTYKLDKKNLFKKIKKIQKMLSILKTKKVLKNKLYHSKNILYYGNINFNEDKYYYIIFKREKEVNYLFNLIDINLNIVSKSIILEDKKFLISNIHKNLYIVNINNFYLGNFIIKSNDKYIKLDSKENTSIIQFFRRKKSFKTINIQYLIINNIKLVGKKVINRDFIVLYFKFMSGTIFLTYIFSLVTNNLLDFKQFILPIGINETNFLIYIFKNIKFKQNKLLFKKSKNNNLIEDLKKILSNLKNKTISIIKLFINRKLFNKFKITLKNNTYNLECLYLNNIKILLIKIYFDNKLLHKISYTINNYDFLNIRNNIYFFINYDFSTKKFKFNNNLIAPKKVNSLPLVKKKYNNDNYKKLINTNILMLDLNKQKIKQIQLKLNKFNKNITKIIKKHFFQKITRLFKKTYISRQKNKKNTTTDLKSKITNPYTLINQSLRKITTPKKPLKLTSNIWYK